MSRTLKLITLSNLRPLNPGPSARSLRILPWTKTSWYSIASAPANKNTTPSAPAPSLATSLKLLLIIINDLNPDVDQICELPVYVNPSLV